MSLNYNKLNKNLKQFTSPGLFVNQNALDQNIDWVVTNAGEKKIRIATKSIRSIAMLDYILNSNAVFQGVMTYSLAEALWLNENGIKDILMGYPTVDQDSLIKLTKKKNGIILMVDLIDHLKLLEKIGKEQNFQFPICIDIDLSLDLPSIRFGVFRSHINSEQRLHEFLKYLKKCSHIKLVGLMGYEAQIAGVGDKHAPVMSLLKKISLTKIAPKRERMLEIIKAHGHELTLVNGGGTGSIFSTRKEKAVSEITVGSAFYAPHLFDHYNAFKLQPSMFYSLDVARNPEPGIYTALGGGYVASGAHDLNKQPIPFLPEGVELLKHEGAGEVQTPFKYHENLKLGDKLFMRYAKAGELCERFNEIQLLKNNQIIETFKTYRGEGKSFL